MALNWVEELVGQLYQTKGYLVVYDADLPMPKTDSRSVRGHSDIDVLAISNSEVVHVECQSWWGPDKASEQKELKRLKDRFDVAPKVIRTKYPFLDGRTILNRFVTTGKPKRLGTDGPWNRLQTFCSNNGIELVEVNTILRELVALLRQKYPRPGRVGKEPSLSHKDDEMLDRKSRMKRGFHVRFCERPKGRFLWPTRPLPAGYAVNCIGITK